MQTFLPFPNFFDVAKCLDNKRLNKQVQECDILLDLHFGRKDNQWKNHPAFKMWIGYVESLILYRNIMLAEWIDRGKNSNREYIAQLNEEYINYPPFLQDSRVIISHRSNLMRKLPEHYYKFGWVDYGIDGYYWPVEVKTKRSKMINKQWDKEIGNG